MQLLDRRFKTHLDELKITNRMTVAVACSGGPDSMALALLVKEWVDKKQGRVVALTVDHGWHKQSADEAKRVGTWLKKHGITHVALPWKGRILSRNEQEAMRKARYKQLADYCTQHKITHLFAAHHLEDQAETFLLRLANGGSVDGLSAMSAVTTMYDITLVRPLLSVSKGQMLDYLRQRKQPYLSEPANQDSANDRVRMRKLLPLLATAGISVESLARTAGIMARARAHLEEETGRFLTAHCKIAPEGYARLEHLEVSEEIALRALSTLMMIVGGQDVKTRATDLSKLCSALQEPRFRAVALAGCVFHKDKRGILVFREVRSIAREKPLKPGTSIVWDNRFEVTLQTASAPLKLGTLSQSGWSRLSKSHTIKNNYPNKNILYGLPTLRDAKGNIIAVPHLKFMSDKSVQCSIAFRHLQA